MAHACFLRTRSSAPRRPWNVSALVFAPEAAASRSRAAPLLYEASRARSWSVSAFSSWTKGSRLGTGLPRPARDCSFRPDQQRRRASPARLVTLAERKPPSAVRAAGRRLLFAPGAVTSAARIASLHHASQAVTSERRPFRCKAGSGGADAESRVRRSHLGRHRLATDGARRPATSVWAPADMMNRLTEPQVSVPSRSRLGASSPQV